jgi:O-antigen ligase
MRALIFSILFIGLSVYSWKDWFKSLCGLIVLTAVMGRPDFPQSFAGIQGLNLWNILFANVFLAWLANRRREGLIWDMPVHITVFLLLWLGVILVGWMRMVLDRSYLEDYTFVDMISEELINTIKWPVAGLLLFDGCRTNHRIKWALTSIVLLFTLFAVQIAKYVPPSVILEAGSLKERREIGDDLGIAINSASKMMSGVPWAILAIMPLVKQRRYRFLMFGAFMLNLYALALTVGRSGYIACGATFVLLCFLRWRRYLILSPLLVLILPVVLPGATARMLSGFGEINVAGEESIDTNAATTGRSVIWPLVIDKFSESPVFGHGRRAMQRTGLSSLTETGSELREMVGHPHQAYLELLLDNGLIGFVIIIGLYTFLWIYSIRLFVDKTDPLYTSAGGFALALLTGHLVANLGGQSFYPDRVDVGCWCAIGLMLRLYAEWSRLLAEANGISAIALYPNQNIPASQTPLVWAD